VEQLFSNANVLRAHFMSAGYKPDTIATNMPVNGGVLLFRGSDAQDHTLILQGTFSQGDNNQKVLTRRLCFCSTSPMPRALTCIGSPRARSGACRQGWRADDCWGYAYRLGAWQGHCGRRNYSDLGLGAV
jgi:hypothetical protein